MHLEPRSTSLRAWRISIRRKASPWSSNGTHWISEYHFCVSLSCKVNKGENEQHPVTWVLLCVCVCVRACVRLMRMFVHTEKVLAKYCIFPQKWRQTIISTLPFLQYPSQVFFFFLKKTIFYPKFQRTLFQFLPLPLGLPGASKRSSYELLSALVSMHSSYQPIGSWCCFLEGMR